MKFYYFKKLKMNTRIGEFFNKNSFNEAGMMTRGQRKRFESEYGKTALQVQEKKKTVAFWYSQFNKIRQVGKLKEFDFSDWISPSQMKYYFDSDPFMYIVNNDDFYSSSVKEQLTPNGSILSSQNSGLNDDLNFSRKLCNDGIMFEEKVYEYYKKQFGEDMLIFQDSQNHGERVRDKNVYKKTKEAILKGIPIICQGVLWNPELKVFGIADMIVRSDFLTKLVDSFKTTEFDEGVDVKAKNLKGNYHYRVIDIKSKTIDILKDGYSLSSNESHRYYKGQIWLYNKMLSLIQGYDPQISYILGKRSQSVHGKNEKFNETFGIADFHQGARDETTEEEVQKCLSWIRESKKYNLADLMKMTIPLPRFEFYPNMRKILNDKKNQFADKIKEISSIYFCGKQQRMKAIEKGFYSYEDERVNAELLGFKEKGRKMCVDIDLMLSRTRQIIHPKKEDGLKTSFFREPKEYFAVIDFEFISDPDFENLPIVKQTDIAFMIGFAIKFESKSNPFKSIDFTEMKMEKTFTVQTLTEKGEKKMFESFVEFINESKFKILVLHHWGDADVNQWIKLVEKYPEVIEKLKVELQFVDMCHICKQEPIMVLDSHGFGLKSYVKNMIEKKIFESECWNNMDCIHGNDAVCYMKKASQEMSNNLNITDLREHPLVKEVEKYNKADCKVLIDMYEGLRNYYEL